MRFLFIYILLMFFLGVSTSCRTVEKSTNTSENLVISKKEMTNDSLSQTELHKLIKKLNEQFKFTFRDITVTTDSAGNVQKHIQETEIEHNTMTAVDSTATKKGEESHASSSVSDTDQSKAESVTIDKEAHIPKIAIIVAAFIIVALFFKLYFFKFK